MAVTKFLVVLALAFVAVQAVGDSKNEEVETFVRMLVKQERSSPVPAAEVRSAIKKAADIVTASAVLSKRAAEIKKRATDAPNAQVRASMIKKAALLQKSAQLKKMEAGAIARRLADDQPEATASRRLKELKKAAIEEAVIESKRTGLKKAVKSILRTIDPKPVENKRADAKIEGAAKELRAAAKLDTRLQEVQRRAASEIQPQKRGVLNERAAALEAQAQLRRLRAANKVKQLARGQTPAVIKKRMCAVNEVSC